MHTSRTKYLATGGIIAALYVILTLLSALFGLSSGVIQVRLSESLCILPCFTPAAIPGLFVGCLISNLLTGAAVPDLIFGSLATLAGAAGTYLLRRHRFAAALPPIAANTLILPPVIIYTYGAQYAFGLVTLFIFLGELLSVGLGGQLLYSIITKRQFLFRRR